MQHPQHGNLTGPRRVVNDNVVTFYNSIQKWNQHYLNGILALQQSKNLVVDVEGGSAQEDADGCMQHCCEKLGVSVELMSQFASQLTSCSCKLSNLASLHATDLPVFKTWDHNAFAEAASNIAEVYLTETKRKEKIAKALQKFTPDSKEFDALVIAWTQLVEIMPETDATLQAMLYEAEIKQ